MPAPAENGLTIENLRREWVGYAAGAALLSGGIFALLQREWGPPFAVRWAGCAGLLLAYLFGSTWMRLADNRGDAAPAIYPRLGLANGITIARAVMTTWLAGFLLVPQPAGALEWAPGGLFLIVILLDMADGIAARATGQATLLGAWLDMHWDSIAVLIAVFLLAGYGQVPWVYVLMGTARYLYLAGLWIHRRLGGSEGELPPSRARRVLGGTQMGFIAACLLPFFRPPATQVAAVLFMIPVLWSFVRDFLAVTGIYRFSTSSSSKMGEQLARGLPVVLRLALSALLAAAAAQTALASQTPGRLGILLVACLAVAAIILGAAGRLAALAALMLAAYWLQSPPAAPPLAWQYWAVLLLGFLVFITGTGKYSLWKPEELLLEQRHGGAH